MAGEQHSALPYHALQHLWLRSPCASEELLAGDPWLSSLSQNACARCVAEGVSGPPR